MGRGIAQITAQAGSMVLLFDNQPQASEKARTEICAQWDRLREKGRMDDAQVAACKQRLQCAATLEDLASCGLVIEAIVERLDAKQSLFASLEAAATTLRWLAFLQPGPADEGGRGDRRPADRSAGLRPTDAICT